MNFIKLSEFLIIKVLRTAIIFRPGITTTKERYALNIPYESVFETIWILSKKSIDGGGREHETICTQVYTSKISLFLLKNFENKGENDIL